MAAAFLLPVAFSPENYHRFWAPKAAVCLLLIVPGAAALARLVRAGSRAALAASLFVVGAGTSTLLSDNPVLSLTGSANWGTGFLFVGSVAGAWALGSVIGEERRRQVVSAIVAAALVNAVIAWLQVRGLVPPPLESPGRAAGLMGNPVHLGALAAGGLWLVGDRVGRDRQSLLWLGPVVLLAGGAEISGGRSGAGLAFVAVVAAVWRAGLGSWPGRARALAVVAAAAVGFALAPAGAEGVTLGSASAVGAESSTAEVGLRFDLWRVGLDAAIDRPAFGWGPGRFQAATSPRSTPAIAGGGAVAWKDAHNWVVEYAVTTGAVGLMLLSAWLALAARNSRGPLAGFAGIVGLLMLVEPQTVGLAPLALLALGASGQDRPVSGLGAMGAAWRAVVVVGAVASVVAAVVLVVGQVFLYHAFLDTSVSSFDKARSLLPPWPEVSFVGSRTEAFYGLQSEPHARRSLELAREATRRDPADPSMWSYLGHIELKWGTEVAAAAAFDRSLEENPWLAGGLQGRAIVAQALNDDESLTESCRRLQVLKRKPIPACGAGAQRRAMDGGSQPATRWRR
ncbi:MAG TPA: O-antigen ligase family protein [Acidimicrobiales bacterium]|nr:O-antigen ligase family protein [Acidimicrobiales bacterium]